MDYNSLAVCSTCGGSHADKSCPFRATSVSLTSKKAEMKRNQREDTTGVGSTQVEETFGFAPLRKKLKKSSTGHEDNFMKGYYVESQQVARLSEADVESIRRQNLIRVEGVDCPRPASSFQDLGLPSELLDHILSLGFQSPTPIQMQAIPCAMSARDVIGLAQTGSGKTLAYLLPLLSYLQKNPTREGGGPRSLILAPTRELVEQIHGVVEKLFNSHNGAFQHRSLAIYGGVAHSNQTGPLQSGGVSIVVATPGRLIDLMDRGFFTFERLSYMVFDEADNMLSMNMEDQLRKIVDRCGIHPRQTLLFSATMPSSVERLARSAVLNPLTITVDEVGNAAVSIKHQVEFTFYHGKKQRLLEVIRKIPSPPVIVFCNNQYVVDKVVNILKSEQFHVAGIHASKTQSFRSTAMKLFKEGQVDILVASDLISRGIDVPECANVVLYDMPDTIEDYIHRAGRTGRFGRDGTCISLLTFECKIAKELKSLLKKAGQDIPRELEDLRSFGGEVVRTELGDLPKRR